MVMYPVLTTVITGFVHINAFREPSTLLQLKNKTQTMQWKNFLTL